MSIIPISAIAAASGVALEPAVRAPTAPPSGGFAAHLIDGLEQVSDGVLQADGLARRFVLDDSIPLHQVTFALEHARMSLELMLQVRNRVLEGYQELLRMQL